MQTSAAPHLQRTDTLLHIVRFFHGEQINDRNIFSTRTSSLTHVRLRAVVFHPCLSPLGASKSKGTWEGEVVGEKILAISTHLAVPSSQSPIVGDPPAKIGAQVTKLER
jgi:hypothetical protein